MDVITPAIMEVHLEVIHAAAVGLAAIDVLLNDKLIENAAMQIILQRSGKSNLL